MSIRNLTKLQKDWEDKITSTANEIDPKLIGFLFYEDIFNDHYANNGLKDEYDQKVHPLIVQYHSELSLGTAAYILDFINDMAIILPSTGYLTTTGQETHNFDYTIPSDYVPCVEIEPVYEAVNSMIHDLSIIPYWRRANYTIFGNNESINITNESTPKEFIIANRGKFNRSFGETNVQKMERAVRLKDAFEYPVHVPVLSKFEDDRIPQTYETAIRRHSILKKVMETENILTECETFTSNIDMDGNVKLKSNNYKDY